MNRRAQTIVWIAIAAMTFMIKPVQAASSNQLEKNDTLKLESAAFSMVTSAQTKIAFEVGESQFDKTEKAKALKTATASADRSAESTSTVSTSYSIEQLRTFYSEAGAMYGIDPRLIEAVHQVETGKSSSCKRSSAGAIGPMQFLRSTFTHYSQGDICDARDAIFAAANLLAQSGAAQGDIRSALFSYKSLQLVCEQGCWSYG
jgi:soluble lytic murein transglycosylase-like protein